MDWTRKKLKRKIGECLLGVFCFIMVSTLGWSIGPGVELWSFQGDFFTYASPAIASDGTLYVNSYGGLYALDSRGNQKWVFQTSNMIQSPPTIAPDGTIYFGCNDGNLYALNPDGSEKWRFYVGAEVETSPAIGEDGTIYFGANNGYFYALNPDGSEKWNFIVPQGIQSSPAIGRDGTIYFGSNYYNFYALNPDGSQKWFFRTNGPIYSSPAIGADETIYFGSHDYFYALNPDGTKKWEFYSGDEIHSSPVIGEDGTIYFFSENGLYAMNPDGSEKWRVTIQSGDGGWNSPIIGNDGTIHILTLTTLYGIDKADGSLKWEYQIPDYRSSSELGMDSDGTIYVGDRSNFYAIHTTSSGIANTPWPMFQRNISHTGRMEGIFISSFIADPQTGDAPLQVGFRCDAYGAKVFQWDFDGDGNIDRETSWSTSRIANSVLYTYTTPGTYNAKVTVVDSSGNRATSSVTITVNYANQSPVIDSCAANPQTGNAPLGVNFTCSASDPDGYIEEYRWDFDGDGNIDEITPSDQLTTSVSTTYTYNNTGTYNATIIAVDSVGNTASFSITITVSEPEHQGPTISSLIASPENGYAPLSVLFTCIGAEGDSPIYHYLWDFDGDGNIDETTTDGTAVYTYNSTGTYNATVTVEDVERLQASYSVIITVTAPNTTGNEKWSFETGGFVYSSPAIGQDGTIYFGSRDNNFYALNPNGTLKWIYQTAGEIFSSPAIGEDGTIYFGSEDHKFYALNPDGSLKWDFQTGNVIHSSPAIGEDGTIYFGSRDGKLYALNPDGSKKWDFTVGYMVDSSPVVGGDGTIYIGTTDSSLNKLYALNPNGTQKWSFQIEDKLDSSPAIGEDGTIYFGVLNGKFYALSPDGVEKWSYQTGDSIYSSPAIGRDGTIYFGSRDGNFYALNPDGSVKWTFSMADTTDWDYSSPAIGMDGTIYFASLNGKLYALNPDGTQKWSTQIASLIYSSPTISSDGTIYIGSYYDNNELHAIQSDSDGLAESPWPMFHRNVRHTGRADQGSTASNQKPTISYFNPHPEYGYVPLNVYFECIANDRDGNIIEYLWDFDGDGEVDETTTVGYTTHTYNSSGQYNATVMVKDNDNTLSDISSTLVNVLEMGTCDLQHIDLCTTEQECESVGGYWYNNTCHVRPSIMPVPDAQIIEELSGEEGSFVLVGGVLSGGNTMKLELDFPSYQGPVDIYVGIMAPGLGLLVLQPDGRLYSALSPYKVNTIGPVQEVILPPFSICNPLTRGLIIPQGEYTVYSLVVPAGSNLDFLNGLYELTYYSFSVSQDVCINI